MQSLLLKYKNYLIFLLILILLILLKSFNPNFIKSISFLSFDLYQKLIPLSKRDSEVIIIDIDEKSLGKFGQFPWNRSVFAKIIENVNEANPKAIGFDIFFSEKDKQSPEEIIKSYNILSKDVINYLVNIKSHDERFRKQLKNSKSVLAVLGSSVSSHSSYDRKAKARFLSKGGDPKEYTFNYPYSIGSLEKLEKSVKGLGSISFLDQTDGIIRSLPLIVRFNKKIYPTMGLEMVRVGENQKNLYVELNEVGIKRISVRPHKILTDSNGIFWIRYKQSQKSQYISASSVFGGNFDKERFKNKYVLIGASAQGLFDLVKTPLGLTLPGVEVHANVIENILDKSYLLRNPNIYVFELLFSIIIAFVTFFLSQKIKPKYSLSIFFISLIAVIVIGFSYFILRSELIDISYPIFILTITFLTGLYFRFIEENKLALENEQKQLLLKKEREIAGEVQKKLFPNNKEIEKYIYARNIPAKDVSGDYYDYYKASDNEFFFILGDVTGKGIKAGILMANAAAVFRSLTKMNSSVSKTALFINNQVKDSSYQSMFITAILGKIDLKKKEMEFINMGHEPMMVLDENFNFNYVKSTLPPMGLMSSKDESFFKTSVMNIKDKTVLIYTDGVTEGYVEKNKELTVNGLENEIKSVNSKNPKIVIDHVVSILSKQNISLRDDITCLGISI